MTKLKKLSINILDQSERPRGPLTKIFNIKNFHTCKVESNVYTTVFSESTYKTNKKKIQRKLRQKKKIRIVTYKHKRKKKGRSKQNGIQTKYNQKSFFV